jgi:hypothetical protein
MSLSMSIGLIDSFCLVIRDKPDFVHLALQSAWPQFSLDVNQLDLFGF